MRATMAAITAGLIALVLSGCGLTMPTDPEGTLDRVSGATLHAGVSPNGDFVQVDDGTVSGSDIELIEAFAASIDADVEWTVASEEALVRGLERGDLDIVAGGLTDETPWVDMAGVTRPYKSFVDVEGTAHAVVMLVPIGENAFLSRLETFLTEKGEAR